MNIVEKYMDVYNAIKAWVMGYGDVKDRCADFISKIEEIPSKATEIA